MNYPGEPLAETRPMTPQTRWRRTLVGLLLILGMGYGGWWLVQRVMDPESFPLRRVRVEGELQHLNRKALEWAVTEHLHGGFFSFDVASLRSIRDQLPWIKTIRARKVWPDRLYLHVTEQQPFARFGPEGVLSVEGLVFRPDLASIPEDLPQFDGPDATVARLMALYPQITAELVRIGLTIGRLEVNERRAWAVATRGGPYLLLGAERLEERLARLVKFFPRLREMGSPEQIDLRYANGFSVRWRLEPAHIPQKPGVEGDKSHATKRQVK
ncbi:MAG: cell division protein FtsQ/DivIB [Pseudomonadota bacterium]